MKKFIWGLVLLLSTALISLGQECNDGILNGTELRMDCGGEGCPPCLHLMYEGVYNEFNELEIYFTVPPFDWSQEELIQGTYYELSNGFNSICTDFIECQAFLIIQGGNDLSIDITKRNPAGDVLGYGRLVIESFCLSCQPLSASATCETGADLSMSLTRIPVDEDHYMLYAEMDDGIPPFRAFDNNYELFYEDGIYESPFYLGRFPDSLDMDLTIFDAIGCKVRMDSKDIINWESETDTLVEPIDTIVNSIEETQLQDFRLYPSIFSNQITIEIPLDFDEIIITNANGEMVFRKTNIQAEILVIPTQELLAGIYFINLQNETSKVVKRAIKF